MPLGPYQEQIGGILIISSDTGYFGLYGGFSFPTTILGALGLSNVFSDVNHKFIDASIESLLGRNPDVIVVYTTLGSVADPDSAALQMLSSFPVANTLHAVTTKRVLTINDTYAA